VSRRFVAVLGPGGTAPALATMRRKGVTHPPSRSTVAVHVVDAQGMKDANSATVRVEQVLHPVTFLPSLSRTGCHVSVVGS
jgi:hypothetical protein